MANVQWEQGYTKIADEYMEMLIKISPYLSSYEHAMLLCIIRQTWGWGKKEDWISNSQFQKKANLPYNNIDRIKKSLAKKNMIVVKGRVVSLQKDWEKWDIRVTRGVFKGQKINMSLEYNVEDLMMNKDDYLEPSKMSPRLAAQMAYRCRCRVVLDFTKKNGQT